MIDLEVLEAPPFRPSPGQLELLDPREIKLPKPPADCPSCIRNREYGMGPSHWASPRCESGGYNHCSCDVCF